MKRIVREGKLLQGNLMDKQCVPTTPGKNNGFKEVFSRKSVVKRSNNGNSTIIYFNYEPFTAVDS